MLSRSFQSVWTGSSTRTAYWAWRTPSWVNTMLLSDAALAALGLRMDDVVLDAQSGYYDHLPIVVDFVIANSS